jgi:ABC-type transport system involved in multi-copper enzyme maturation permease subunit
MTALATTVPDATSRLRRTVAPALPLSRIVRVELRKMFDTRSGFWLMASIVLLSVAATGAAIVFAPDEDLTYSTFGSMIGFPIAIVLPIIAALSVTSEWSQRSGLTTFTLVPNRSRVILAKGIAAVGIGVVSIGVAFAVGALGNLVGTTINGTPLVWDVSAVEVLLVVLGNVLGLLLGFMLGLLIRNSPGAIVAYFVLSFVLTGLTELLATSQAWFRDARGWLDFNFAQGPLFSFEDGLTGTEWAHLGITAASWIALPLLVALVLVRRSEVK